MHSGNFVLILHTHLPWVMHHDTWPHGEHWLTEAVSECYIPLLNVFNDLNDQGIPPKVTLDISPILCEQLEHKDFKPTFEYYCEEKIKAAEQDEKNFKKWGYDPHHVYLAQFWQEWFAARLKDYRERYNYSIVGALKDLQDKGAIEVMTCGATHGYLPLLATEESINLQIKAGVENYKKYFDRRPRGIWLPECAYRPSYDWKSYIPVEPFHKPRLRPGIEQFLARNGIEYFVIDQKLLDDSYPIGAFLDGDKDRFVSINSENYYHKPWNFDKNPLRLYEVSSSEKTEYGTAAAFVRHRDIAMQVWSGEVGYPGEPDYLDFHKKHMESLLRYWRVTDNKADMMYKTLYHPDWVWDKLDKQSNHFIHHIENSMNYFQNLTGKFGTLAVPFDTELFGHWWFEGPEFLRYVIKGLHFSPYVNAATCSEQMFGIQPSEVIGIPEGSWGVNNNHDVWINESNKWTWEAIYNNELRLKKFFEQHPKDGLSPTLRRIVTQALRELMLLQSSDWQFLIYTQSAKDYAERRFSFHHSDFNRLMDMAEDYLKSGKLSDSQIALLEKDEMINPPFQELKLEWWEEPEW